ncbi:hypothetical protein CLUG_03524 [Clavispora lusitaniae ATCC 42720]|uniref:Uncharacterized protein n=1 Tax=Clavispora lusitaniae (strain ATCC 42720) TaxID=306902 RepID=C4Y5U0_CLAL4|nr:uncharacterized protein CLUG_03524 [Clavispora lusitaniae ATCC 42720]EEQ39396.1 hypothetical protein CLUG_03524 [Clavispora lusitaniae ATCC 42720]
MNVFPGELDLSYCISGSLLMGGFTSKEASLRGGLNTLAHSCEPFTLLDEVESASQASTSMISISSESSSFCSFVRSITSLNFSIVSGCSISSKFSFSKSARGHHFESFNLRFAAFNNVLRRFSPDGLAPPNRRDSALYLPFESASSRFSLIVLGVLHGAVNPAPNSFSSHT